MVRQWKSGVDTKKDLNICSTVSSLHWPALSENLKSINSAKINYAYGSVLTYATLAGFWHKPASGARSALNFRFRDVSGVLKTQIWLIVIFQQIKITIYCYYNIVCDYVDRDKSMD